MKTKIIELLEKIINKGKDAAEKINRVYADPDLSDDGRQRKINQIFDSIAMDADNAVKDISTILKNKINALDEQEEKELRDRFSDLEYQNRLKIKKENLKEANLENIPLDILKVYLSEFNNDPVAVGIFGGIMSNISAVSAAVPVDERNIRQERIKKLSGEITAAVSEIKRMEKNGNLSAIAILENRLDYIKNQDEDFSLTDNEVALKMTHHGAFNFGFKRIKG